MFRGDNISHRCTVVGNPGGGGVLGVLAKIFLGGYLGLSENLGGSTFFAFFRVLLHFFVKIFVAYPPSPLCASMIFLQNVYNFSLLVTVVGFYQKDGSLNQNAISSYEIHSK